MSARYESHRRHIDAAEQQETATWLEAARGMLKIREEDFRSKLRAEDPSGLDMMTARRHIAAIRRVGQVLATLPGIPETKMPLKGDSDIRIRRIRRQELLCPQGWRDDISAKLASAADASEEKYLASESPDESDIYDAIEMRNFVTGLDFVWARGEEARASLRRDAQRGAA